MICYNCYHKFKVFTRFIERCKEIDNVLKRIKVEIGEDEVRKIDTDNLLPENCNWKEESNAEESLHVLQDHSYFTNEMTARSGYIIKRLSTNVTSEELQVSKSTQDQVEPQQPKKERLCDFCNVPVSADCSEITKKCEICSHIMPEVAKSSTATDIDGVNNGTLSVISLSTDEEVVMETISDTDADDILCTSDEVIHESKMIANQTPFKLTVLDSLACYEMLPHNRAISIPHAEHTFPQLLNDLNESGIEVFRVNPPTKKLPLTPQLRKRVLLFGSIVTECVECNVEFENHKLLKAHFKKEHCYNDQTDSETDQEMFDEVVTTKRRQKRDAEHYCSTCEKHFPSVKLLRQHLFKIHKQPKPYTCQKCGKSFFAKMTYLKHLIMFKDVDCKTKKCSVCSERFDKIEYDKHMRLHKKLVCETCGSAYATRRGLISHIYSHKNDTKTEAKNEGHLCSFCGKLFRCSSNLFMHMKRHQVDPNQTFMCDKCPKVFKMEQHLKAHMKRVHVKDRVYKCTTCNKTCSTSSGLKSHTKTLKRAETPVQDMWGKFCTRRLLQKTHEKALGKPERRGFAEGSNRTRYIKKSKFNPVTCKYCSKICKNVYVLRMHVLNHIKAIRYKCRFCPFTFSNATNRYRHEKRHKDPDFELSCKICWKRMKTKEELEFHCEKHNQTKKYECNVCAELLPSKYHVLHHMSEKHISKEEVEMEKNEVLKDALEEFLIVK
ncbi:hypothetical protein NQ318_016520 [Aromia moschata]|uniref:C2H2-type domain-containing protein n=1 Tax=Aromia moschata TaxID=1265417 RepID=A0AAV8YWV2_9CUCU|nr:hypothetical protein NQ318_016520 [Aromia moschata]